MLNSLVSFIIKCKRLCSYHNFFLDDYDQNEVDHLLQPLNNEVAEDRTLGVDAVLTGTGLLFYYFYGPYPSTYTDVSARLLR